MALSLAVGVGVTVFPYAFQDQRASPYTSNFWPCTDCSDTLKGLRNGLMILLSTGYCIGTVIAMILNFILPADAEIIRTEDLTGKTLEEEEAENVYAVRETVSQAKMLELVFVIFEALDSLENLFELQMRDSMKDVPPVEFDESDADSDEQIEA